MKLRTLGRALLRRWYVVVAGLAALAGLCYVVYGIVPVDYKTSGSVVLLPSAESMGKGTNPYLYLTGLGQAMDVLTRRMAAPDVAARLTMGHPSASYTVLPDVTSGSSILVVTVKSRSASDAQATMAAVIDAVPAELAGMQDELKVPAPSRISSMPVAQPTDPLADGKPRLQATAGLGAAGLLGVLVFTGFLDGLLLRKSRRAGRKEAAAHSIGQPVFGASGSDPVRSVDSADPDRILVPALDADSGRRQKHQVSR
ncbi:hypothetical protein [Sinomonas flava]|uniref:hypothetical protein n=1 Tax=Sinomonas flava TaxID=496857 RepID=UPI0039A51C42